MAGLSTSVTHPTNCNSAQTEQQYYCPCAQELRYLTSLYIRLRLTFWPASAATELKMLDILDFIEEKGGDPKAIRESQRRRYAPVEVVDEVIALYEDHRKSETTRYRGIYTITDTSSQPTTQHRKLKQKSTRSRKT
jgi:hypothetical protein